MDGSEADMNGVLLLHGFGGAPFEMQGLADVFSRAGYEVDNPLLPGHGGDAAAWNASTWDQWADFAEARFLELSARTGKTFVIGQSMGGLLALEVGRRLVPKGIVTIAAPTFLYRFFPPRATDWRLVFLPLLKRFRPLWPMPPRNSESAAIMPWEGFEGVMALDALSSFMSGMARVRRGLSQVVSPLLALHSPGDASAPSDGAWEILNGVSSASRTLKLLPVARDVTSRHVLTTHARTRERVEELCLDFVDGLSREETDAVRERS